MLIADANLLLHAVSRDAREHTVARGWPAAALGGVEAVALAWTVILAFIGVSTHPSVLTRPLTAAEAVRGLETWLAAPAAIVSFHRDFGRFAGVRWRLPE